jgi:hypothetical protein
MTIEDGITVFNEGLLKFKEKIGGKLYKDYLYIVLIIIIFLTFLNLFITTYFYFTSLIEANANRSNCGIGGLTEAETFRHIFLQDNGNDKVKDIYIFIIIIFAIYLLYEIFKVFTSSNIANFDISNTYIGLDIEQLSIIFLGLGLVFLYSVKIHFVYRLENSIGKSKDKHIAGVSILGLLLSIILLLYPFRKPYGFNDENKYGLIALFCILLLCVEIPERFANGNVFKAYTDKKVINTRFKANTALSIIFIVLYVLCIIYIYNNRKSPLNVLILAFLLLLIFTLFIFILLSSIKENINDPEHANLLNDLLAISLSFKWFALLGPIILYIGLKSNQQFIKLLVVYYAILFIIYLFYVYFVNHNKEAGVLALEYFQLYNFNFENDKFNKTINISNSVFIGIFLIILLIIAFYNDDINIETIIYSIIVFIIASYITGSIYIIYNLIFPIQEVSIFYKQNLIEINKEISKHITTNKIKHNINKEKIITFKLFDTWADVEQFKTNFDLENIALIKKEFIKLVPKNADYNTYVLQSKNQQEYELYILEIFENYNYNKIKDSHFSDDIKLLIYKKLIIEVPNNLNEIKKNDGNSYFSDSTELTIPIYNNLKYIINKNYKYITHDYTNELKKLNGSKDNFYTIGYDNDTADNFNIIPAKYYACAYLNYYTIADGTNEDGNMSKTKFAKYIGVSSESDIVNNIDKYYNIITQKTKSKLAPEKFYFLLMFLVILAIIILINMFSFIKKYFTDDVYTPQMYVLGILAVFLSVFIFGEVIFSRIK